LHGEITAAFLGTSYIYALVNKRDEWHEQAKLWRQGLASSRRKLVTTELILVEIGDGLAALRFRYQALETIKALQSSSLVEVVRLTSDILADAIDLYGNRSDKDWGLTDCVSFVVMRTLRLTESPTVDRHFQEAGFRALLRENPRPGLMETGG
jgi:predicted nucleic acid-binding protein